MDPNEEMARFIATQIHSFRKERDWYKRPCYGGKDTKLKEKPYCYACKDQSISVSALKRCSRCHVAWYCSAKCQKKHFTVHREVCKRVAEDASCVEREAIPLRTWLYEGENEAENLFETMVGNFAGHETRNYLEARANLADDYWDVAYDFEVKEVWEKSLSHYLELLRLDATCPREIRFRLPYILLYLNRDDEAYSFIRYWLQFDDLDDNEILSRHESSQEGEWIYPNEPNCRYRDIYEDCPNIEDLPVTVLYMVAIAIIKMRIVASNDAVSRLVNFAFEETILSSIKEVHSLVHDMLADRNAASQRQQLDRLFDRMHAFMLDALRAYEEASEYHHSVGVIETTGIYPFPINMTLSNGLRDFYRVPGASDILQARNRTDG